MSETEHKPTDTDNEFVHQGAMKRSSLAGEIFFFLKSHRKWWMLPLLILFLLFGGLLILSGTGAAPFIYTLF